jgi:hypothetical protein
MTDAERRNAERGTDSVVFKTLLAAMEGSAKRSLRYSRVAGFLSALEVALLLSAAASLAAHVFTGGAHWQFVAVGVALVAVAAVSSWLQSRLYDKALKELDRLELLAVIAALAAGRVDMAQNMLMLKMEELKRRLRGSASG